MVIRFAIALYGAIVIFAASTQPINAQQRFSDRLPVAPDIAAIVRATMATELAGAAFPTDNLYDGRPFSRTDLGELYTYDATNTRWLGELRTTMFGYKDGIDGAVAWFGQSESGQTEADLGPSFVSDVLLADVQISWDGPINSNKSVDIRSNTTVLSTVNIFSGTNRTEQLLNVVLPSNTYLTVFVSSAGDGLVDPWINVSFRKVAQ